MSRDVTPPIKAGLDTRDGSRFPVSWRVSYILLCQVWRTRLTGLSSYLEMVLSVKHAAIIAKILLRLGDATTLLLLILVVATSAAPLQLSGQFSGVLPYLDVGAAFVVICDVAAVLAKRRRHQKFFRQYGSYSKKLGVLLSVAMYWKICVLTVVIGMMALKLSQHGAVLAVSMVLGAISLIGALSYPRLTAVIVTGAMVLCGAVLVELLFAAGPSPLSIDGATILPYLVLLSAVSVFSLISVILITRPLDLRRGYRCAMLRERESQANLIFIIMGIVLMAWLPLVAGKDFPAVAEYKASVIMLSYFLYCIMARILLLRYTSPEALGYLIFYFKARQIPAREVWLHYNVNFVLLTLPVAIGLAAACFFTPLGYAAAVLLLACVAAELALNTAVVMRFFRLYPKVDLPKLRQTSKTAVAAAVLLTMASPMAGIPGVTPPLQPDVKVSLIIAACLTMVALAVAGVNRLNYRGWSTNLWEPVEAQHV